jgi:hypothetical protein
MKPVRIAMWSGPRNISTAMMRAWENREDCAVIDEPLYAAYLMETGLDHPGRDEVITDGETDWERVVEHLLGPVPGGKPVWYQKHMSHHLLPEMDREWIHKLHNIMLIRDPDEVVASYLRSRADVEPEDIGLLQQAELFDELAERSGKPPLVIDAGDFLRDPGGYLRTICDRVGIGFSDRMLGWPAGKRDSDGVWAPHWYDAVWKSTGFEAAKARGVVALEPEAAEVAQACRPAYEKLHAVRLLL